MPRRDRLHGMGDRSSFREEAHARRPAPLALPCAVCCTLNRTRVHRARSRFRQCPAERDDAGGRPVRPGAHGGRAVPHGEGVQLPRGRHDQRGGLPPDLPRHRQRLGCPHAAALRTHGGRPGRRWLRRRGTRRVQATSEGDVRCGGGVLHEPSPPLRPPLPWTEASEGPDTRGDRVACRSRPRSAPASSSRVRSRPAENARRQRLPRLCTDGVSGVAAGRILLTHRRMTGGRVAFPSLCGLDLKFHEHYLKWSGIGWPAVRIGAVCRTSHPSRSGRISPSAPSGTEGDSPDRAVGGSAPGAAEPMMRLPLWSGAVRPRSHGLSLPFRAVNHPLRGEGDPSRATPHLSAPFVSFPCARTRVCARSSC